MSPDTYPSTLEPLTCLSGWSCRGQLPQATCVIVIVTTKLDQPRARHLFTYIWEPMYLHATGPSHRLGIGCSLHFSVLLVQVGSLLAFHDTFCLQAFHYQVLAKCTRITTHLCQRSIHLSIPLAWISTHAKQHIIHPCLRACNVHSLHLLQWMEPIAIPPVTPF